jgi:hypothetical protein
MDVLRIYTLCCISLGRCCFGLETRVSIKTLKSPCYPINVDWFSLRIKMADSKIEIFNSHNSQYFFAKMSWIGNWVSRIDWCEGHWCGSTYMVMRASDISSKAGKKWIYCVFGPFLTLCRTASWPYRLSHINALCINQF